MKVSERLQTAVLISAMFAPKFIFVSKMKSETFLLFNQKKITLYKENKKLRFLIFYVHSRTLKEGLTAPVR